MPRKKGARASSIDARMPSPRLALSASLVAHKRIRIASRAATMSDDQMIAYDMQTEVLSSTAHLENAGKNKRLTL